MEDEDGYTILNPRTRAFARDPAASDKGLPAVSPRWRPAAVTLGIVCLGLLGATGILAFQVVRPVNCHCSSEMPKEHFQPSKSPPVWKWDSTNIPETTITILGPRPRICPLRWIRHGDSCYLLRSTLDNWSRSKRFCVSQNSQLLQIDNQAELDFIKHLTSNESQTSVWIGLSSRSDGSWIWGDGSAFSPDLFDIRQTNILNGCAWIHENLIFNALCNSLAYCICEKKVHSST
ncbi:C-type lectin domain family 7 member A isoform X2 [Tachyglossus aculeatus]|nr:C-type lectin domain family 7 member A isoform X2 [Tachyglossus aculeatus]